jgi:hypothetical protein
MHHLIEELGDEEGIFFRFSLDNYLIGIEIRGEMSNSCVSCRCQMCEAILR